MKGKKLRVILEDEILKLDGVTIPAATNKLLTKKKQIPAAKLIA